MSGRSRIERENEPHARARVSSPRLATAAQLMRLNQLGLVEKALAGAPHVTAQNAWTVLEEALEAGLWETAPREHRPDWAPPPPAARVATEQPGEDELGR